MPNGQLWISTEAKSRSLHVYLSAKMIDLADIYDKKVSLKKRKKVRKDVLMFDGCANITILSV